LAAENSSPTATSRRPHAASYEATLQATGPLSEAASTTSAALSPVLKWVGVALLIVACLLAIYLEAGLLGEWAARAAYP
jgi:hypothetical protein